MPDYLTYIGGPLNNDRYAPAYQAILTLLQDGNWHHIDEVRSAAQDASDLEARSIDNLIRWGHKRGQPAHWQYRGRGQDKHLRIAPQPHGRTTR